MIENFAALEYKTQEEVLTVIRHVTSVLSVAGVYTADILLQATDEKLDSVSLPILVPNYTTKCHVCSLSPSQKKTMVRQTGQ